jgi:hypothetical protein
VLNHLYAIATRPLVRKSWKGRSPCEF